MPAPKKSERFWNGDAVRPDAEGRCGRCGASNFKYSNGNEVAADGTRGYRCVECGCVKPENWMAAERCAGCDEPATKYADDFPLCQSCYDERTIEALAAYENEEP